MSSVHGGTALARGVSGAGAVGGSERVVIVLDDSDDETGEPETPMPGKNVAMSGAVAAETPKSRGTVHAKLCTNCSSPSPKYGLPDGTRTHCKNCKTSDMVDLTRRLCAGCHRKQPNQGYPGGSATHCAACKLPGMKNVVTKPCQSCGEVQPAYRFPDSRTVTHCTKCKLPGMIHIRDKCVKCRNTFPSYGVEPKKPTHCLSCKEPGMTNVVSKLCEKCKSVQACFGTEFGGPRLRCAGCAGPGMFDITKNYCTICRKVTASQGLEDGKATHCFGCKEPGMVNVVSQRCASCDTICTVWGFPDGPGTHCAKCKVDGMVRLRGKLCKGCNKVTPSYGLPGESPTHCSTCRTEDMVVTYLKLCTICDETKALYGEPGGPATHCSKCRVKGMVDVVNRMCDACHAHQPRFGFAGGRVSHCGACRSDDMVDLVSKKCVKCNTVSRNQGYPGGPATHCASCKEEGMINVVSKRCIGCQGPQPSYGYPDQRPTHCFKCRDPNMVDVVSSMCEDCGKRTAVYGLQGGKPSHCSDCRQGRSDLINIYVKRCDVCEETMVPGGGTCAACFVADDPKFRSAPEKAAFQHLQSLVRQQKITMATFNRPILGIKKISKPGHHGRLEFDLMVELLDGTFGCIELDGNSHFQLIAWNGNDPAECFTNQVLRDAAKDQYLLGCGVRVARIPLQKRRYDDPALLQVVTEAIAAFTAGARFHVPSNEIRLYAEQMDLYESLDTVPLPAPIVALRRQGKVGKELLVPQVGQPALPDDLMGVERKTKVAGKRSRGQAKITDMFPTAKKAR